jgi:hypothetical protein
MALPATLNVSLDFSTGATFGVGLTLDDPVFGLLDTGILAESETPSLIADLTSVTRVINIRRGRNLTRDTYEAGVLRSGYLTLIHILILKILVHLTTDN